MRTFKCWGCDSAPLVDLSLLHPAAGAYLLGQAPTLGSQLWEEF